MRPPPPLWVSFCDILGVPADLGEHWWRGLWRSPRYDARALTKAFLYGSGQRIKRGNIAIDGSPPLMRRVVRKLVEEGTLGQERAEKIVLYIREASCVKRTKDWRGVGKETLDWRT
jgi:hypothetical protein